MDQEQQVSQIKLLIEKAREQGYLTYAEVNDHLPEGIVDRPKKGFGMPVAAWLRGPLRGWMRSVLAREKVAAGGLLDPDWTDRLVEEHAAGVTNHRKELWSAMALELWRRGPYGPG